MKKFTYTAALEEKGTRLDTFISSKSGFTRSHIQKLIRQGLITVNSRKGKTAYMVKEKDSIEVSIPDEREGQLIPEDIPIDIVLENEHIIVVNKPPHMVTHPASGNRSGTLMNAVIARCKELASIGAPMRPGVVHRLDKETSGLIIIAKSDEAYYSLIRQFREREIEKQYIALLYGKLKEDRGEICSAIGRSVSDRKKMSTRTRKGKEAITRFDVVRRFTSATLAKVSILTGRTHQIRVHFASVGHPVLGDKTYGKKTEIRHGSSKIISFPRQMLHASSLKFRHPISGEILELNAPVPEDMETAVEKLSNI